ncbi:MAG: exo-alpha-sialidase [Candidatus Eisenbacteria bacterium]|nr:exo-alpha-sialidase [Candidatus Eisenbacteria bacterium]
MTPSDRNTPHRPGAAARRAGRLAPLALACALLVPGCTPAARPPAWAGVREITPPELADVAAFDPGLAVGPRGRLALTWVTRDSAGAGVWLAVAPDSAGRFGAPRRLDDPAGRVSSYSESRPVAAFGPSGQLVVAWAAHRDSGGFADDIVSRASADGGATFGPPVFVNDDSGDPKSTYHGFLALDFSPDGRALAAWLDGRGAKLAPGEEEPARAQVRLAASLDEGHSWQPSVLVAAEGCPCCRLAMRADSAGRVVIAYRGAHDDLRDPRLAISRDGGATFALDTLVSADRWLLPGCPSVGPALSANRAGGGLYAWFTGAEHESDEVRPGVYLATWRADVGRTGPRRMLADSLREASRPMLAGMGATTLAGVIARPLADTTARVLAVRAVEADGAQTPWLFLGAAVRSAALAGAGPRRAYAVWIERPAEQPRLRLARLDRR